MLAHSLMVRSLAVSALVALLAPGARALDTVTRKTSDRRVAGEITAVSSTEVTVTPKAGAAVVVPANDILSIDWEGAPAALALARAKEASGQYALALADYETAQREVAAGRPHLRADIAFGIASATARLAAVEPEQLGPAVARLNAFLETHPDHYRYYDALVLLGQTRLAQQDFAGAQEAFGRVSSAPWADYQMAARIGLGRTALARGDLSAARAAFEEVAAMTPSSRTEAARRFEALLGQAACLQRSQQYAQAAQVLTTVIQESTAEETRQQAEAYIKQGECLAALPDRTKEAIMAFLHVDVIPALAKETDLHAEALYHLAQLWPQLGHTDRADHAASRLQSLYPNSLWTRKLAGE